MGNVVRALIHRARAVQERARWYAFSRRLRWYLAPAPSVIASNCVGGKLSEAFGAGYQSPTVGLWFEPEAYLAFVERLSENLSLPLVYDERASRDAGHPVGTLGEIRIYFKHYKTFEEAREKWLRRCARVNYDRLLLCFTDRDGATLSHLERFDKLDLGARVAFVHRPLPHLRTAVHVPCGERTTQVPDLYQNWRLLARALRLRHLTRLRLQLGGRANVA